MSKPQEVWELYKSLLRSKRFVEWGELCWSDNGVFEVAYPREGVSEEKYIGRNDIVSFFSGSADKIEIDFKDDVIHETTNPNVFFATFEFNAKTISGYQYKNRIVSQVTLEQGKIEKLIEYADPIARQCFFKELQVSKERRIMLNELPKAVVAGDLQAAERLLNAGAPVDGKDAGGYSPLMIAAGLGQVQMVELLLVAGADPNLLDSRMGASALHKAAQGGVPEVAQRLLHHGAFIDMQSPTLGHTPLHDAVWHKKLAMVKFLLSQDAKTTLKTHGGLIPLVFARRDNLREIEAAILAEDERRATLVRAQRLMAAVVANDLYGVRHTLATGADVNEISPMLGGSNDGHTPLLVAALEGYTSIVQELLTAGADPRLVDGLIKATPGHKAGYQGHTEIARLLTQHNLEIDAQGPYNGYTALHDAVWHGHTETVKTFLEAGARTDLRGHDGRTPLAMALQDGYPDCAALLNAHAAEGAHNPANELRSFVYQWFSGFDRHVEEQFFLGHLAHQGLEMRFPERTLHSHADFQDWYEDIRRTIRANTHDVSGLRVTSVGENTFHVDLFVWWRAVTHQGETRSMRFRQNWEVASRNGQFIIQRLQVEVQ